MAAPRPHRPVKLIVGLLGGDVDLLRRTRQLLARRYGPVDLESDLWPFDDTDYYRDEMGPGLMRLFVSFERLIRPDALAQIKLETNRMETSIAEDALLRDIVRPVNIDPGYVDLGKLVLATTKNHAHRVYLSDGIYAEVTLRYSDGGWQPWPWTYPDFSRAEYHAFFERVRRRLKDQYQALMAAPGRGMLSPPGMGGAAKEGWGGGESMAPDAGGSDA